MSKRSKKRRPAAPAKFMVGDRVRVRPGIRDEDHPDIPIGGWTGTIREVHRDGMYTVRWSRDTLQRIHPIYRKRCAIDGTALEEYWLREADLEPDPGGPLSIEQPTEIAPRPLSADEQGDRVRMVFGLTSDDFLPAVDQESLETYYDYLDERLSLPFKARYEDEEADFPMRVVTVVALGSDIDLDEDDGIFCEIREGDELVPLADLELRRSDPNRQLVDDYTAWFVGDLAEDTDDDTDDQAEPDGDAEPGEGGGVPRVSEEASWRSVALMLLQIITFGVSLGAVAGSAVAVMPWAKWGACLGGGLLGVFEAVARARSAQREWSLIAPRFRKALGGAVGAITGAVEGALFGIMAVAFIGALAGGIAGALFKRIFAGTRRTVLILPGGVVLIAAACGVAAQAFYMDHVRATEGLLYGSLAGLAGGLFLCLVALPLAFLTVWRPDQEGTP